MKKLILISFVSLILILSCNKKNNVASENSSNNNIKTRSSSEYYSSWPCRQIAIQDDNDNIVYVNIYASDSNNILRFIEEANLTLEVFPDEMIDTVAVESNTSEDSANTVIQSPLVVEVDSAVFHADVRSFTLHTNGTGTKGNSNKKYRTNGAGNATYTANWWWHSGMICFEVGLLQL